MLETSLIHDLRTISAQQQKILCGLELIKEEKNPPVLVILRCLAKKKKKKTWLKVLSALFSTVYWSPKTVPWLPAKYICYYGNQSKQGNRRKNRGELKTWLMWIYGSERVFVEVCWEGGFDSVSHVILLSVLLPAVIDSKIWRWNIHLKATCCETSSAPDHHFHSGFNESVWRCRVSTGFRHQH